MFCNERTRSTLLDPKLKFRGISDHFVTTLSSVQNELNRIFCNECTRCTPLDAKLMFSGVLDRFVTARTSAQNGLNWSLMHMFVEWSRVGIFCNERTRSTPLDPKLMFSGVSNCFVTSRTLAQNGPNQSLIPKFVERSRIGIFRKEWNPIHPIASQTHIFGCFGPFRYCLKFGAKWSELVINAQIRGTKPHWNFSQWTHGIHPIGPQTHVLGHFGPFRCYTNFGAKRAQLVPLMHKFEWTRIGNFRTRSTPLDPKLMFLGVSEHCVTPRTVVRKRTNRCQWCTSS
jgi:hypothetical protein